MTRMDDRRPGVLQIVGYKKTGKTTLMCRLVEQLASQGIRVGTVKHDAHDFEPDVPGTDSWRIRHSGASWTAIVSPVRTAFIEEKETELDELLDRMKDAGVILVEGFKRKPYPKLVLIHEERHLPILDETEAVVAVVTWNDELLAAWSERLERERGVSMFRYEDAEALFGIVKAIL